MMGYGYGQDQARPDSNLTPSQEKGQAKSFIEDYIQRYLPDYKLTKKK